MPTASAAIPTRPLSSTPIIMWKPRFSGPSRVLRQLDAIEAQRADR